MVASLQALDRAVFAQAGELAAAFCVRTLRHQAHLERAGPDWLGHFLQALDRQLSSLEAGTSAAAFSLESLLAEVEDLLSYCNDILGTGTPLTSHSEGVRMEDILHVHASSWAGMTA